MRDLEPLGVLVEHRVDDVDERLVAREEAVPTGEQVAFEPALAQVLAQNLHHAAVGCQMIVAIDALRHPRAIRDLEQRVQPVRRRLVRPDDAKVACVDIEPHHVAQQRTHHARCLRVHRARLGAIPPTGDVVQLVEIGSHCRGALFVDATPLRTPALEAAFDRVGREMMHSHPLVAKLLAGVVLELRAGRSREDALHRMGERARVDQIRSFVTLVIQSDRLGSSIGKTLRVYAAEMRERRRLAAEERAHRLPVLLSIPLVACMLPVMIGVLMLPAAIRVVRELIPAMAGGG